MDILSQVLGITDNLLLRCRFLYDGTRINDDDTPATLDMEDNGERDAIDFVSFPLISCIRYH